MTSVNWGHEPISNWFSWNEGSDGYHWCESLTSMAGRDPQMGNQEDPWGS